MSEVKRYDCSGTMCQAEGGDWVCVELLQSAQSELSALREELAKLEDRTAELSGEVLSLKLARNAAEQRNAALVKAATEFMEYAESGWDHFPDVGVNLREALTKPAESGASE